MYVHVNTGQPDQGQGTENENKGKVDEKAGATGDKSVTAGVNAKATAPGSVALGSESKADRNAINAVAKTVSREPNKDQNQVYSPLTENVKVDHPETSTLNTAITETVKGNLGAVSVGNEGNTRQIINVAAGSADTDAVNVAQLKALAGLPITVEANEGGSVPVKLGDRFPVKGKENGGIVTRTDIASNGLTLEVKPDGTKGVEVGAGGVAVKINDQKGVQFGNDGKIEVKPNANKGVEVTAEGVGVNIDDQAGVKFNGGKVAVNLAPNKGLEFDANNGHGIAVKPHHGITVDENGVSAKPNQAKGVTVDGEGIAVNIANDAGLEFKMENGQGKLAAKAGDGIEINDKGINVKPKADKGALTVDGDGVSVNVNDQKGIEVGDDNKLAIKVNPAGPLTVDGQGLNINVDDKTIKLEAGKVAAKTTDLAVDDNGPNKGKVKLKDPAPNGGDALVTADTVMNAINDSGFILRTSATDKGEVSNDKNKADGYLVKPSNTVTVEAGDNIAITQDDGKVTIRTKRSVIFDDVQFGDNGPKITKDDQDNLKVSNKDGQPVKITNVANGIGPNDAVNVSQLETVKNSPITVEADQLGSVNVKLGDRFPIKGATNGGIITKADLATNGLTVEVKPNNAMGVQLTPGGVAVKIEEGNNNPLQFGGKGGIELKVDDNTLAVDNDTNVLGGDKKLKVKLADKGGITTKTDGDANSNGLKVDVDNTTVQINEAGKVAAKTTDLLADNIGIYKGKVRPKNIQEGDSLVTAKTVANAINNSGFILTATKGEGELDNAEHKELIKTGETVTIDAGKNIKLNQTAGKISIATKDDVNFTSVQFGDNGPKIQGGGDRNTIKLVNDLDGPVTIANLKEGVNDNDAVNVKQLKDSATKYFADEDASRPQDGETETTAATSKGFAKTLTDNVVGITGGITGDQANGGAKNITTKIDADNNTIEVALNPDVKGLNSLQFAEDQGIKVG
ncbi:hypothetical protein M2R47_06890, partial [Moraxella sp. Tifton1]|nr:hypothetical protein [Moraxella sp. Tifton1]